MLQGIDSQEVHQLLAWLSSKEGGHQWWWVAKLNWQVAMKTRVTLNLKLEYLYKSLDAASQVEPGVPKLATLPTNNNSINQALKKARLTCSS